MYHEHADGIYRFAYWRVADEEQAQDVLSIVFVKAWESRDKFDGQFAKAWLYKIARNTIIDGYRKKTEDRLPEDIDIPVEDGTGDKIDSEIAAKNLLVALGSIPDELREVVHWRFIERKSVKETAERTGHSESNVRVMQFRALKKLRIWYEKRR